MKNNTTDKQQLFVNGVSLSWLGFVFIGPILWIMNIPIHDYWWAPFYTIFVIVGLISTFVSLLKVSFNNAKSPLIATILSLIFCGVIGGLMMMRGDYVKKETVKFTDKEIELREKRLIKIHEKVVGNPITNYSIIATMIIIIATLIIVSIFGVTFIRTTSSDTVIFEIYVLPIIAIGMGCIHILSQFYSKRKYKKVALIIGYIWGLILGGVFMNKGIKQEEEK